MCTLLVDGIAPLACAMEIEVEVLIRGHDVKVTKTLRAHVELQIGFALSRFGEHIDGVTVHLSKSDEQRNSVEKRCRIAVRLRRADLDRLIAANLRPAHPDLALPGVEPDDDGGDATGAS